MASTVLRSVESSKSLRCSRRDTPSCVMPSSRARVTCVSCRALRSSRNVISSAISSAARSSTLCRRSGIVRSGWSLVYCILRYVRLICRFGSRGRPGCSVPTEASVASRSRCRTGTVVGPCFQPPVPQPVGSALWPYLKRRIRRAMMCEAMGEPRPHSASPQRRLTGAGARGIAADDWETASGMRAHRPPPAMPIWRGTRAKRPQPGSPPASPARTSCGNALFSSPETQPPCPTIAECMSMTHSAIRSPTNTA